MIFENLSEKLQGALNRLRGKGKLSEKDVDLAMREVKLALLESDVTRKFNRRPAEKYRAKRKRPNTKHQK